MVIILFVRKRKSQITCVSFNYFTRSCTRTKTKCKINFEDSTASSFISRCEIYRTKWLQAKTLEKQWLTADKSFVVNASRVVTIVIQNSMKDSPGWWRAPFLIRCRWKRKGRDREKERNRAKEKVGNVPFSRRGIESPFEPRDKTRGFIYRFEPVRLN